LDIVEPKESWLNSKAKATSVGAYDILKKAKVFKSTYDVIKNYDIVISLSARKRDINKKHISMRQFQNIIIKKNKINFGLMFGPEASGLSNYDLSYSNYILQIPTSKKFKSLNLSHSLTLVCYEIFKIINSKVFNAKEKKLKIASKNDVGILLKYLKDLLNKKSFFTPPEKKKSMIININNLIYRLEPNNKELRILASILSTLYK
jgi:tRNA/rRNA methyltransferase